MGAALQATRVKAPEGLEELLVTCSAHGNILLAELNLQDQGCWDFPGGAMVKNLPANAGDTGSIPGREDPTCHGATKPVRHNY